MTPQMNMGRHIVVGLIILALIRIEALSIIIVAVIAIIVELEFLILFYLCTDRGWQRASDSEAVDGELPTKPHKTWLACGLPSPWPCQVPKSTILPPILNHLHIHVQFQPFLIFNIFCLRLSEGNWECLFRASFLDINGVCLHFYLETLSLSSVAGLRRFYP